MSITFDPHSIVLIDQGKPLDFAGCYCRQTLIGQTSPLIQKIFENEKFLSLLQEFNGQLPSSDTDSSFQIRIESDSLSFTPLDPAVAHETRSYKIKQGELFELNTVLAQKVKKIWDDHLVHAPSAPPAQTTAQPIQSVRFRAQQYTQRIQKLREYLQFAKSFALLGTQDLSQLKASFLAKIALSDHTNPALRCFCDGSSPSGQECSLAIRKLLLDAIARLWEQNITHAQLDSLFQDLFLSDKQGIASQSTSSTLTGRAQAIRQHLATLH